MINENNIYVPDSFLYKFSVEINACDSSPCFNGGTCLDILNVYAYTCQCPSGYYGSNCESKLSW